MALRERERDPELPARAGEAHLRPPDPGELCALVEAHLKRPEAPAITAATWDYARWKPGVSITSVFTLHFADGTSEPVVAKRYVDGKERTLKFPARNEARLEELCPRLRPHALLPERALALWVPPADRVVRGLPVLLERKKLGNLVTRSGITPSGSVKKRKTEYTLLRYKPERRAVYRLDLRLRGEDRPKLALAARALPPAEAARVVAARAALAAAGGGELAPPVAATNLRQGFLLEPWLALESFGGGDFTHARAAGERLAALHALPPPDDLRRLPLGLPGDLDELFAVDAELLRLPRVAPHPAPRARGFCHGDFHPDQVARCADGRWLLMDLDCLAAGDPAADLANWIADWIVEHARVDLEAASGELLEAYRSAGARAPEPAFLAAHVAAELVNRACATLRRLEQGAIPKARFALESARRIVGS
jgi:aminoglycoside phosphotransferase (APT) family kinase protein